MGSGSSALSSAWQEAHESLERLVGTETLDPEDSYWDDAFDMLEISFATLDPESASQVIEERCQSLICNCLRTRNFRNLLIVLTRKLEHTHRTSLRYQNPEWRAANFDTTDIEDELFFTSDAVLNLLFLVKIFTKYIVEVVPPEERVKFFTFADYHEPDDDDLDPNMDISYSTPKRSRSGRSINVQHPRFHNVKVDGSLSRSTSEASLHDGDQVTEVTTDGRDGEVAISIEPEDVKQADDKPTNNRRYYVRSGQDLHNRIVEALVDACVDIEMSDLTYEFHLEVMNVLLVLTSSQMHGPMGDLDHNPFLRSLLCGPVRRRAPELIQTLLYNFMDRLPAEQRGPKMERPSGFFSILRKFVTKTILLPVNLFSYLFPPQPVVHSLSDRSAVLFLILVHQRPSVRGTRITNAYSDALKGFHDDAMDNVAPVGPIDGQKHAFPAQVFRIGFGELYDAIATCLPDEWAALVMYSVLYGNQLFRDYVFSRSDLDMICVPLLQTLYSLKEVDFKSNRSYMILIILLILSQDASFGEHAHRTLNIPKVPWFKEQLLSNISLGSLMIVILLRTIQHNLWKLRDPYLHTNCLAALANVASHCAGIHPYAARSLVSLLHILSRRFQRIAKRHNLPVGEDGVMISQNKPSDRHVDDNPLNGEAMVQSHDRHLSDEVKLQIDEPRNQQQEAGAWSLWTLDATEEPDVEKEKQLHEMATFTEFIRLILEVTLSCLRIANMAENVHLIYWLVQYKQVFVPFKNHERFADVVTSLLRLIEHFERVMANASMTDKSLNSHLRVILDEARVYQSRFRPVAEEASKFNYVEDKNAEEFFLPYIWDVISHMNTFADTISLQEDDGDSDGEFEEDAPSGSPTMQPSANPQDPERRVQSLSVITPISRPRSQSRPPADDQQTTAPNT